MNVFESLSQAARQWPGRPAIIDAAGSLDYQSLWREIESLRAQLARLDVRQGLGVGVGKREQAPAPKASPVRESVRR